MNVYFISGLGADKRAFDKIKLEDPYNVYFIDWLEPEKNESLEHYAQRMAEDIDKEKPFVLIGLSFGGIISIEIAKRYKAEKVILISSLSCINELAWYYKLLGRLHIQNTKLIPLLMHKNQVLHWFFGTKSKKLQDYLNEMIDKMTLNYLQWSLDKIVNWKQGKRPENVYHLHGGSDKLFSIRYCHPDKIISRGGHFMVVTHAKEISSCINEVLRSINR